MTLARGLCAKHYQRMHSTGTTELRHPERGLSDLQRLESLEVRATRTERGCLVLATRAPGKGGYLNITLTVDGRKCTRLLHRWAYEVRHGVIDPPNLQVRHKCDNPPCFADEHLVLGTALDNSKDKYDRRRVPGFTLRVTPAKERAIVALSSLGWTDGDTAEALDLETWTVARHRRNLLGIRSNANALDPAKAERVRVLLSSTTSSQVDIAREVGVSPTTVRRIEQGHR